MKNRYYLIATLLGCNSLIFSADAAPTPKADDSSIVDSFKSPKSILRKPIKDTHLLTKEELFIKKFSSKYFIRETALGLSKENELILEMEVTQSPDNKAQHPGHYKHVGVVRENLTKNTAQPILLSQCDYLQPDQSPVTVLEDGREVQERMIYKLPHAVYDDTTISPCIELIYGPSIEHHLTLQSPEGTCYKVIVDNKGHTISIKKEQRVNFKDA